MKTETTNEINFFGIEEITKKAERIAKNKTHINDMFLKIFESLENKISEWCFSESEFPFEISYKFPFQIYLDGYGTSDIYILFTNRTDLDYIELYYNSYEEEKTKYFNIKFKDISILKKKYILKDLGNALRHFQDNLKKQIDTKDSILLEYKEYFDNFFSIIEKI